MRRPLLGAVRRMSVAPPPPPVGLPRCISGLRADESRFLMPLNAKKTRGVDVLNDPLWNKGTGFTPAERDRLGLRGLLPNVVRTIDEQRGYFMDKLREIEDPMEKNLLLRSLHDRNETLFHRVLVDHVEEVAPLVYTPTVGLVCQRYSSNFTRPRGLLLTPDDKGSMGINMENWPHSSCQVVVVTDGSRILGLGDLGANGMGIPVGKLALYCAYGGIAPHRVLPVQLDFGTDNQALLEDPLYTGVRQPRLKGDEYFALVDEFVQAVFRRYPKALLQFEDFSSDKASVLLGTHPPTVERTHPPGMERAEGGANASALSERARAHCLRGTPLPDGRTAFRSFSGRTAQTSTVTATSASTTTSRARARPSSPACSVRCA